MAKHQKRLIAGLVAGIVAVALVTAGSALVSRASSTESDAVDNVRVVDDRKLPERWAIDAAYGRGALSNLRAALGEIENEKADEARKGVAVAQSLLGKIEPRDSVLIHSEVRLLGNADPENTVQAKLDSLRSEIDMSDHDAIIAALDSLDVPLAYTRIDLPLSETIALVDEALLALDARDTALAHAKLLQIGDALRIDTVRLGVVEPRGGPGDDSDAG